MVGRGGSCNDQRRADPASPVWVRAQAGAGRHPEAAGLVTRIENLGLADWALWRRDGEASVASVDVSGANCVVVDLGSLPRAQERSVVALAMLGRRWAGRAGRKPVLIAVDEAHNVFPAVTDDPLLQAAGDLGALVAGEGRKFGIHRFVATQRPAKVHANVVSQCDNLVLMRMNGTADVEDLTALFSHVPAPLVRRSLTFGLGQALCGARDAAYQKIFIDLCATLKQSGFYAFEPQVMALALAACEVHGTRLPAHDCHSRRGAARVRR